MKVEGQTQSKGKAGNVRLKPTFWPYGNKGENATKAEISKIRI